MATRKTTHILKNSDIAGRPLPATLLGGEPIVNTADGIVYFSGVTQNTNNWTPSGTGPAANFFEVGSNLYDLKIRNKITTYGGSSGASLVGKFLSGTTDGFVLADISSIAGVDTFVTGFSYANNVATITRNQGQPNLSITINSMTGLTVNGTLTATTTNTGTANINTLTATAGTITTLNTTTLNLGEIATYAGTANVAGKFLSGTTTGFVLADISSIAGVDTIVTGFSYTPTTNTITLSQNGQTNRTVQIGVVSGLTISNLTADRLVYTSTGGKLITGTAIFDGTDMTLPNNGRLSVGTGGLVVGSGGSPSVGGTGDLVVNGSLTVYGPSVSAFTSELYIEDNNIILNFNPTGDTSSSSDGAGWTIQDGSGVFNSPVNFDIRPLNNLAGIVVGQTPSTSEYSSDIGYSNRGWVTQLNDIIIRSTDEVTPNGVRVLGEFDILDGGVY